ncbi:DMT family transporter [Affinibrenneria salicis]|uniref:Threonine/homoserine exporter RhtA n=1 Tax=Affinibrenneria salicis TaxID=2590031 RepID=A0A5J5G523_9GAMM|nr:DMT family transporter [Affinibrenneria salicis]KAA9001975.1 DMT family transporter [Affinibrenneria salicis]
MNIRIYAKLMLSAFFWGGSAIAGKYALQDYSPALVTFARFFIAALIVFLLVNTKKTLLTVGLKQHLQLFIIALAGVSLCYYFYFRGLLLSSAFNAGIIEATTPLLTLLIAALCGMERLTLRQLSGLLIAWLGVGVTMTNGDWRRLAGDGYNVGDLLLLVSTLCFGVYNILTRRWQMAIPDRVFMFWFFFYGSMALLPWLIGEAWRQPAAFSPRAALQPLPLLSILFMAAGGSVIAYLFFNQGIRAIGASAAAAFINLVPFVTVFLSVCLLGERVGIFQWTGAVTILVGVLVASQRRRAALARS